MLKRGAVTGELPSEGLLCGANPGSSRRPACAVPRRSSGHRRLPVHRGSWDDAGGRSRSPAATRTGGAPAVRRGRLHAVDEPVPGRTGRCRDGRTRPPAAPLPPVGDELRRLIITGELPPGSRLVEDRLAVQLGVSRNPVREALQALAGEGFVDLLPRRGAVVAQITPAQAEELFDVRGARAARRPARRPPCADAGARPPARRARAARGDRGAASSTCSPPATPSSTPASSSWAATTTSGCSSRRWPGGCSGCSARRAPPARRTRGPSTRGCCGRSGRRRGVAFALASAHVAAARASYRAVAVEAAPGLTGRPARRRHGVLREVLYTVDKM